MFIEDRLEILLLHRHRGLLLLEPRCLHDNLQIVLKPLQHVGDRVAHDQGPAEWNAKVPLSVSRSILIEWRKSRRNKAVG